MANVITWNTTKTAEGYQFKVYSFGYQISDVTLKTGVCASRAIAASNAKKWVRYYKACK